MKNLMEWLDEAFEERAGILEFCAGMPRKQAEEAAQIEVDNHRAMRENVARDSGANK